MARPVHPAGTQRPAPVFEMCVHGRAVSAQTNNRRGLAVWKRLVARAAAAAWFGREPLDGGLELHVLHYDETMAGDLDNLNKPIQDALQGVAFLNDRQITLLRGGWRDINGVYHVRYIAPALGAAFSDGRPFVHIRVWRAAVTEELD